MKSVQRCTLRESEDVTRLHALIAALAIMEIVARLRVNATAVVVDRDPRKWLERELFSIRRPLIPALLAYHPTSLVPES